MDLYKQLTRLGELLFPNIIEREVTDSNEPLINAPLLPIKRNTPIDQLTYPTFDPNKPTLFLDIDGVLHVGFNESLSHLSVLLKFLETRPCQIVLSSTWREMCDESYLKARFGLMWAYVVGYTPKLADHVGTPNRETEILHFVKHYNLEVYYCLDDDLDEFTDRLPIQFVNRDTALTDADIKVLEHWYDG